MATLHDTPSDCFGSTATTTAHKPRDTTHETLTTPSNYC